MHIQGLSCWFDVPILLCDMKNLDTHLNKNVEKCGQGHGFKVFLRNLKHRVTAFLPDKPFSKCFPFQMLESINYLKKKKPPRQKSTELLSKQTYSSRHLLAKPIIHYQVIHLALKSWHVRHHDKAVTTGAKLLVQLPKLFHFHHFFH